jgi:hypothetical protein
VQRSQEHHLAVAAAESHARQLLQRCARNPAKVLGRHRSRREGVLDGVDIIRISVLEDEVDPVVFEAEQPVADQARHPDSTLVVECEAIRETSAIEGNDRFAGAEAAIPGKGEADQAPAKRFDRIQPGAGGIRANLVGIVQAVGDNTGPELIRDHDEAIRDVLAPGVVPGRVAGTDRDPHPAAVVRVDEVRRRQRNAIDLGEKGYDRTVAMEPPDAATGSEIRDETRPIRQGRDTIRSQLF